MHAQRPALVWTAARAPTARTPYPLDATCTLATPSPSTATSRHSGSRPAREVGMPMGAKPQESLISPEGDASTSRDRKGGPYRCGPDFAGMR